MMPARSWRKSRYWDARAVALLIDPIRTDLSGSGGGHTCLTRTLVARRLTVVGPELISIEPTARPYASLLYDVHVIR